MEEIKELITSTLEQKRVLSRLKAELRVQVFLAIDEQEKNSGNDGLAEKTSNPQRDSLLKSSEGLLLVALVREFLEWSGMEFTAKVYEPEMGPAADYRGRMDLVRQLGVQGEASPDSPLLLTVLKRFQSGGTGGGGGGGGGPPHAASHVPASALPPPVAPVSRLAPLAPLGRQGLAPLDAHSPPSQMTEPPKTSPPAAAPAKQEPPKQPPLSRPDTAYEGASRTAPPASAAAHPAPTPQPAASAPTATVPGPGRAGAGSAGQGDRSFGDSLEIEDEADLEDAEIVDEEDEDLSSVFTKGAPAQGSGGGGSASGGAGGLPSSRPAVVGATVSASGPSADGTPPPLPKEEPSETSLSTSGFTPGRIRPGRSRLSGGESGLIADDATSRSMGGAGERSGGGAGDRSGDIGSLSGDRSFGISHELAGLAPPPMAPSGGRKRSDSGGLSLSGELPPHPDSDSNKASPTGAGGLSRSGELSGLSSRGGLSGASLGKLDPLGAPGGLAPAKAPLGKLAPLGPLGGPKPLAPLGAPAGGLGRKDPGDIKEELRRAGLLTIDSAGNSAALSMDLDSLAPPPPSGAPPANAGPRSRSTSRRNSADGSRSLSGGGGSDGAGGGSRRGSGSGGGSDFGGALGPEKSERGLHSGMAGRRVGGGMAAVPAQQEEEEDEEGGMVSEEVVESSGSGFGDLDLPDNSLDIELPDNGPPVAAPSRGNISSGGGARAGSALGPNSGLRSGGGGSSGGGGLPPMRGAASGVAPGAGSNRPPLGRPTGGIYDAEFSVSQSMDIQEVAEEDSTAAGGGMDDLRSSLESEAMTRSGGFEGMGGSGGMGRPFLAGARVGAVSMDLRDTGLSASDQSGDLEHVFDAADLGVVAETAEWEDE